MSDFNLDNLLDAKLDDIADLPEYRSYPAGTHRVTLALTKKELNKHPAMEVKMTLVETMELADSAETPLTPGATDSVAYMLDNEWGLGAFKKILKPVGAHFGETQISKIVENMQGLEVVVVTRQRPNKEKTKSYTDIVELLVV